MARGISEFPHFDGGMGVISISMVLLKYIKIISHELMPISLCLFKAIGSTRSGGGLAWGSCPFVTVKSRAPTDSYLHIYCILTHCVDN
jgi:hypothetical protein